MSKKMQKQKFIGKKIQLAQFEIIHKVLPSLTPLTDPLGPGHRFPFIACSIPSSLDASILISFFSIVLKGQILGFIVFVSSILWQK
jgi:hypothetical protein